MVECDMWTWHYGSEKVSVMRHDLPVIITFNYTTYKCTMQREQVDRDSAIIINNTSGSVGFLRATFLWNKTA